MNYLNSGLGAFLDISVHLASASKKEEVSWFSPSYQVVTLALNFIEVFAL